MKKTANILQMAAIMFIVCFVTSCNQIKLSDQEAKAFIIKDQKLPKSCYIKLILSDMTGLNALQNAGLITYSYGFSGFDTWFKLTPTDLGKPYYLGLDGRDVHKFRTYDIDFDKITGISVNREEQTAIVRFTTKAINITPIATTLSLMPRLVDQEIVLKKFDTGWQLK